MALLSQTTHYEFEVHMMDDAGNMLIEYVLSPDLERAAWQGHELSNQRNCTLKDVVMCYEE